MHLAFCFNISFQQSNKQQGFSLLESLIVLSLLASLSLFVLPNMQAWQQNHALKQFESRLSAWLINSQAVALNQGCAQQVHLMQRSSYQWQLSLQAKDPNSCREYPYSADILDSSEFKNLHIHPSQTFSRLVFDSQRVRIQGPSASLIFYIDETYPIKLSLHNISSRARICAMNPNKTYGYESC